MIEIGFKSGHKEIFDISYEEFLKTASNAQSSTATNSFLDYAPKNLLLINLSEVTYVRPYNPSDIQGRTAEGKAIRIEVKSDD